jgi:hypothetical protein
MELKVTGLWNNKSNYDKDGDGNMTTDGDGDWLGTFGLLFFSSEYA